jgi:hypothetical protein
LQPAHDSARQASGDRPEPDEMHRGQY